MSEHPIPSTAAVAFGSVGEAERPIAGIPAAARIVRELAQAGFTQTWLELPAGAAPSEAAMAEIHRLAPPMAVRIGEPPASEPIARFSGNRLVSAESILAGGPDSGIALDWPGAAAEILRQTGKPTDGPVSRWLNRPVSRSISALLLQLPGLRPIHATAVNALLGLAMFLALIWGDGWGLIAGGLLFQAASIFDGVDGEMARATFRSSPAGAALDTWIDTATNAMFLIGLTVNLVVRGQAEALWLAAWGLGLFALGLALIGWHAWRTGRPFSFNRIKQRYHRRAAGTDFAGLIVFATVVSSRDFFCLLFAVLLVIGLPLAVLYIFAVAASVWIVFVLASLVPSREAEA
jgi:phosphatidylglycerophosphate synthase